MGNGTKTRTFLRLVQFSCERWCAVDESEIGKCFLVLCEAWTFNENKIEPFRTRPLEASYFKPRDLCLISSNDSYFIVITSSLHLVLQQVQVETEWPHSLLTSL